MRMQRQYIVIVFMASFALVFIGRLFYLQIINSRLKEIAQLKTVKSVRVFPERGTIYDRNGKLIVTNAPVYDLVVTFKTANKLGFKDTLGLCKVLNITKEEFIQRVKDIKDTKKNPAYSYVQPQVFIDQISEESYHSLIDKFDFPGFEFLPRTIRKYPYQTLANTLGYIGRINPTELKEDQDEFYTKNDFIAKTGVEKTYEKTLRGYKGVHKFLRNERGTQSIPFKNGKFDTAAIAGDPLISTIDIDLQMYAEKLMKGKRGSVVAIEPSTGEILSIVTAPSYDPNLLTGRDFSKNFIELRKDSLRPLYDRSIRSPYPPGSTFKTVCGLIALQDKIITPTSTIKCPYGIIGDHAPPGYYNVHDAIRLSSNTYFCLLFMRHVQRHKYDDWHYDSKIGLMEWRKKIESFGIGRYLGADIYHAGRGNIVPDTNMYKKRFPGRWNSESIKSLGIGQGEMSLTPLHMANMCAAIANRGYWITPHIIKGRYDGGEKELFEYKKHQTYVDSVHFPVVIDAMEAVIKNGTASRANIPDITIVGKTGTAENPHGKDHSLFISFAPKENPKIAIAVIVENSGYGGTWAAPIARLMTEKYLTGKLSGNGPFEEKRILEFDVK